MEHHPVYAGALTASRYPAAKPYQAGSLTGAVASQNVTEAFQVSLRLVGNQL
jgi:hypothetical protein